MGDIEIQGQGVPFAIFNSLALQVGSVRISARADSGGKDR